MDKEQVCLPLWGIPPGHLSPTKDVNSKCHAVKIDQEEQVNSKLKKKKKKRSAYKVSIEHQGFFFFLFCEWRDRSIDLLHPSCRRVQNIQQDCRYLAPSPQKKKRKRGREKKTRTFRMQMMVVRGIGVSLTSIRLLLSVQRQSAEAYISTLNISDMR